MKCTFIFINRIKNIYYSFPTKTMHILLLLCIFSSLHAQPKDSTQNIKNELVISQMNYCINTLTNIIYNKSMIVLEHESNELINNLTMEQVIGLPEIRDFRIDLLDAISKFEITEEEKLLMKRIQSIKRDNAKWNALASALNPTMLITGGGHIGPQIAFQVLLSAARTAVEYKAAKGEQQIEELQAMWELRKEDMRVINEIRKSAFNIVFSLYEKFHLKESDRLTENTSQLFSQYITEIDANKRIRLLEDNFEIYKHLPEYYYHLSMAYIDINQYEMAKTHIEQYLTLYDKAPILRYDKKSGCIALAKLTYEKELNNAEKERLIQIAISNLPSNSAAILQCAMVYLYEMDETEKGLDLLRLGIDDPNASDREILYMAAGELYPIIKNYPKIANAITNSLKSEEKIGFDIYWGYMINTTDNLLPEVHKILSFENTTTKKWYSYLLLYGFFIKPHFNEELSLVMPPLFMIQPNSLKFFIEEHDNELYSIKELTYHHKNSVEIEDINDINCFKNNKNLKYLFFDVLVPNKTFFVKSNLDYSQIKDGSFPRMSEFTLTDDDIEDIIDFCKKHASSHQNTILNLKEIDGAEKQILEPINKANVTFEGKELSYVPHHSLKQKGYYLKIVLPKGILLTYKFDPKSGNLLPYAYYFNEKWNFANAEYQSEYEDSSEPMEEIDQYQNDQGNNILIIVRNFFKNIYNKICSLFK